MAFRKFAHVARRALAVGAVASLTLVAGCGDDSTGPNGDVYALFSIGTQELPIVETLGEGTYTLKSGSVVLAKNGTYTFRVTETFKPTGAALQTAVWGENGTWVLDGDELTLTSTHDYEDGELTPSAGDITVATKTDTQISYDDGTDVWLFKKS